MTLKVIGAGFGRTGTLSAYTALNQLGFPCYHMFEVIENKANKSHMNFWLQVANSPPGTAHNWESVFEKYTAAVDNPACCVWRELLQAYPDAKVLLTLHPRGPEAWYESTMETIYFTESHWQFKLLAMLVPPTKRMAEMTHTLIWQRNHKGTMPDRAAAIAHYKQHIEDVKAAVPADRLLIFTADQGWEPLCKFLGVPVPSTPFPNVNDRAQMKKVISAMTMGAYVILGVAGLAVAGLLYSLYRSIR